MIPTFEKHVFISDVHLGGFDEITNKSIEFEFLRVIDWAVKNKYKIHFLGDIFDYWMEFESGFYPNEFDLVLSRLKQLHQEQGPATFITGNHDNWTLGLFEQIGLEVIESFVTLEIDKKHFFLMHGDGILLENGHLERPVLHRLLRNLTFLRFFRWICRDRIGIEVMKYFSLINRKLRPTTNKDAEKLTTWVKSKKWNKPIDFILCGHDHNPRSIRLSDSKYLNLGAFYKQKTFAIYTNSELKLVLWNSEKNQPVEYHL